MAHVVEDAHRPAVVARYRVVVAAIHKVRPAHPRVHCEGVSGDRPDSAAPDKAVVVEGSGGHRDLRNHLDAGAILHRHPPGSRPCPRSCRRNAGGEIARPGVHRVVDREISGVPSWRILTVPFRLHAAVKLGNTAGSTPTVDPPASVLDTAAPAPQWRNRRPPSPVAVHVTTGRTPGRIHCLVLVGCSGAGDPSGRRWIRLVAFVAHPPVVARLSSALAHAKDAPPTGT